VHDWAEVHRLHHVEGMGKAAIAAKLGMSRTTVHRLLGLNSHLATSGAGQGEQPGRAVLLEASPPAVGARAGNAHLDRNVRDRPVWMRRHSSSLPAGVRRALAWTTRDLRGVGAVRQPQPRSEVPPHVNNPRGQYS
jgi:hypothetical protein